jgi:glycosyltransferase involved in cell wall biosynthesis
MPKVSVVLTSYNHSKYIKESIDSVLSQTFKDFELIIWDDASTDNSWEIIQSYQDSRIRSFRNEKNEEASVITKALINGYVKGELVAIHHSDDIWDSSKLEKQVKFLDENPAYGAVFSDASAIDERSNPLGDETHFYNHIFNQRNRSRHEWLNYFFYNGNALCHPSVLIRKNCYFEFGPYRYGLAQLGDLDVWIKICIKYQIYVYPEKLVSFRVRDNEANASGSRPDTRIRNSIDLYIVLKNYLLIKDSDELIKIFPKLKIFSHLPENEPLYLLSKVFLDDDSPMPAKLLGLETLFNVLNDEDKKDKVRNIYSINFSEFVKQSARFDVFAVEELPKIVSLQDQNKSLKQELQNVYNSKSWRITTALRKINSWLRL